MEITPITLLVRIAVGTLLGGVIGYERTVRGRPAGLRTHILVALASSTFMVVSTHFIYLQRYGAADLITVDPSRIASSIVSGIGFLAGGAILRSGLTVRGLTTAAGLWLVAAIGMSAGSGMYDVAFFVTMLGLVVLTVIRRFEHKDRMIRRRVSLVLDKEGALDAVSARLVKSGALVSALDYDKQPAVGITSVTAEVRFPRGAKIDRVVRDLEALPGIQRIRIEAK